ncbi:unnamed protein product, partial [Nesidiocoris tenuis]
MFLKARNPNTLEEAIGLAIAEERDQNAKRDWYRTPNGNSPQRKHANYRQTGFRNTPMTNGHLNFIRAPNPVFPRRQHERGPPNYYSHFHQPSGSRESQPRNFDAYGRPAFNANRPTVLFCSNCYSKGHEAATCRLRGRRNGNANPNSSHNSNPNFNRSSNSNSSHFLGNCRPSGPPPGNGPSGSRP